MSDAVKNLGLRAKAGDLHAIAQLGVFYLVGHQVARDVQLGFEHVKRAAEGGEIASQTLVSNLYAAGMGTDENWGQAYDWLLVAAQNGDQKALGQITYFIPDLLQTDTAMTWQDVRIKLGELDEDSHYDDLIHHNDPPIRTVEEFLDPRTCDYLMKVAEPFLNRAYVNDGAGGAQLDPTRTNWAMSFFPLESDLVVQKVNKKIAELMEQPVSHGEPLSVMRYEPGQAYLPHYDYFNPDYPAHVSHLKTGGQRIKTFLVYLNDGYEAGETQFPNLNWQFKGGIGDSIIFDNVREDGSLIENSLHSGLPPLKGEKWIVSKWLKDKPQY